MNCTHLAELPLDVLSMLLPMIDSVQDQYNLCLVSKLFHNLCEPLLYRSIEYKGPRALQSLVSRLVNRPDLARRVQYLSLKEIYPISNIPLDPIDPADLSLYKAIIENATTDESFRSSWIRDLEHGNKDALINILLLLVPNVKEMQWWTDIPLYMDLFRHETKTPTQTKMLSQLRELYVCSGGELDFGAAELQHFTALPSLTRFECEMAVDRGPFEMSIEPGSLRSLSDIQLYQSMVSDEHLNTLIRGCKSLRRFAIEFTEHLAEDTIQSFDLDTIGDSLQQHKYTLQSLKIDMEDLSEDPEFDTHFVKGRLCSLRDFTRLRHVELSQRALIGTGPHPRRLIETLPANIETLVIRKADASIIGMLWELNKKMSTEFPHLKHITVVQETREIDIAASIDPEKMDTSEGSENLKGTLEANKVNFNPLACVHRNHSWRYHEIPLVKG
jgi:hypothetical protein